MRHSSERKASCTESPVLRVAVSGAHCHLCVNVTDTEEAQTKNHPPWLSSSLQPGISGNHLFCTPTLNLTQLLMSGTSNLDLPLAKTQFPGRHPE